MASWVEGQLTAPTWSSVTTMPCSVVWPVFFTRYFHVTVEPATTSLPFGSCASPFQAVFVISIPGTRSCAFLNVHLRASPAERLTVAVSPDTVRGALFTVQLMLSRLQPSFA